MSIQIGMKLGPYEIVSAEGAGGMGEVYKANDTRLNRTVAIKVISGRTTQDEALRSRFEREAKAISSLNHPNICTLYDIGHQDGIDFLVMEYIEGESLSDRLKKGPLDLSQVFEIASEIADALTKAHEKGLIHRDIKPANVMLTKEGSKLLDFGLAKLQMTDAADAAGAVTQTTPLTGTGTIVGTMQYMAPEQLEGQEADNRSDIFAFGALLYEMITGIKAFEGKSQANLIAAIIEREPVSVSEIKPLTPPGLARLVRKCLAKDPSERWQSARDLSDELRWIAQSGSQAGISAAISAKRRVKFRLAWVIAGVTTIIAAVALFALLSQSRPEPTVKRFQVDVTPAATSVNWPKLSPDGRYLAYRASDSSGTYHIWIRPLNSLESHMIPGTDNARRPFWSPDSKYLAFMNGDQLKRVALAGGPAQMLAEVPSGSDGSWGSKGIIALDGSLNDSIRAVKAAGGTVMGVTKLDPAHGELYDMWPCFLPDGEHFLYVASSDSSEANRQYTLRVGSIHSDDEKELIKTNSMAIYAYPGYLIYARDKILVAQPFDPGSLEITGEPVPVTDKVRIISGNGMINVSASDEGTLAMQTDEQGVKTAIKSISYEGVPGEPILDNGVYIAIALSPNDSLLAYTVEDEANGTTDIWIRNLNRKISSRLTFEPENHVLPVWTPRGDSIIYTQGDFPKVRTMIKPADGSGEAREIHFPDSMLTWVMTISPDGKKTGNIILRGGQPDIAVFSLDNINEPTIIADSKFQEFFPRFSPDGRYIAYMSNESGEWEVYVRRSDGKGGKWQVSDAGGLGPIWSKDGSKLFYYSPGHDFMVSDVSLAGTFESNTPKVLFNQPVSMYGMGFFRAAVTSDGKKWIFVARTSGTRRLSFDVVLNWAEELKQR